MSESQADKNDSIFHFGTDKAEGACYNKKGYREIALGAERLQRYEIIIYVIKEEQ